MIFDKIMIADKLMIIFVASIQAAFVGINCAFSKRTNVTPKQNINDFFLAEEKH